MNIFKKYFSTETPHIEGEKPTCVLVAEGDVLLAMREDCMCTTFGKKYTVHKQAYRNGALFVTCKCGVHYLTDAEVSNENPKAIFRVLQDHELN
jgi:hypothetical protein